MHNYKHMQCAYIVQTHVIIIINIRLYTNAFKYLYTYIITSMHIIHAYLIASYIPHQRCDGISFKWVSKIFCANCYICLLYSWGHRTNSPNIVSHIFSQYPECCDRDSLLITINCERQVISSNPISAECCFFFSL